MIETKIEKVELFKDRSHNKSWNDHMFDENGFTVEFKGGKARVYSNQPFAIAPRSRYAKLRWCGSIGPEEKLYQLQVQGRQVFMKVKYDYLEPEWKKIAAKHGIKFDDITEDDATHQWSQLCDVHTEFIEKNCPEIGSIQDGGSGICGVEGCQTESNDYIDF